MAKECDAAQEKVNQLRESNYDLESKLGEERKKLRDANLTIHRLQLRLDSSEAARGRGGGSESERRSESGSTNYEARDNEETASVSGSRRYSSDTTSQPSYRDRYTSRDSPVGSRRLFDRSERRDRT